MQKETEAKKTWYNRLLCGVKSPFGNFADIATFHTEVQIDVPAKKEYVETKCWCCTFWRGIIFGAAGVGVIWLCGWYGVLIDALVFIAANVFYRPLVNHRP